MQARYFQTPFSSELKEERERKSARRWRDERGEVGGKVRDKWVSFEEEKSRELALA